MSMRAQAEPSGHGHEPEEVAAADLPDRRHFVRTLALGGAAVAAGAAAIPAVAGAAGAVTSTTIAGAPTIPAGDITLVNFALGLELAASQLYAAMITTGKLTSARLGNARLYQSHHNDHATALTTLNADAAVFTPNAKLLSQVGAQIASAATEDDLVQIAFDLESSMAATHQYLLGTVTNWQTATTEAELQPVEAQHTVVWGQTLNLPTAQWMPAFQNTTGFYDPATYAAS
jgi:Ferritin-like domain